MWKNNRLDVNKYLQLLTNRWFNMLSTGLNLAFLVIELYSSYKFNNKTSGT